MKDTFRNALVVEVASKFRTFGGGNVNKNNPISIALKDQPSQFAAGVDVGQVVDFIANRVFEEIDNRLAKMK